MSDDEKQIEQAIGQLRCSSCGRLAIDYELTEIARLRAENERLRERNDTLFVMVDRMGAALTMYANPDNWSKDAMEDDWYWDGMGEPWQLAADALRGEEPRPSGTPADVEDGA